MRRAPSDFSWYLGNQGLYFLALGIGMVLVPWLVTVVLNAPPERVGLAQSLIMLPLLLFMLFGGATADRRDLRRWLMRLHLVQIIAPLCLAFMLFSDTLSYWLLVSYGVTQATISAFVNPARDSLLSRVAQTGNPGGMQRAVGFAIAAQTAAQFIGITVAGQANAIGPFLLPLFMVVSYLGCAFALSRIAPAPPSAEEVPTEGATGTRQRLSEIGEGIGAVWRSSRIRPVIILMFFSSLLFMGAIMVMLPLFVRDVYSGGAETISIVFLCFFGSLGISSAIVAKNPIHRQGRAVMLAGGAGALVMALLHLEPPLWGFYLIVVVWGLLGGVSSAMSRTIVQSAASESHRGRILSVFNLAIFAGGPIGSFVIGYLIAELGILNATLAPPLAMVVIWLGMFAFTPMWRIADDMAPDAEPAAAE